MTTVRLISYLAQIYKQLLSWFIKPDKNSDQLIIGFAGKYYAGNLKSVYEALLQRKTFCEKPFNAFWVTTDRKQISDFEKHNVCIHQISDLMKFPTFLKTNIWLSDHGEADIPVQKNANNLWIQLWHGIPFKGFAGNKNTKRSFNHFDLNPVSSRWLADYYIQGIGVDQKKVCVTGYPRSDDLIKNQFDSTLIYKSLNFDQHKKTILYAPTWAQDSERPKPLFPWGNDITNISELVTFLENNNLQFLIRTHPNWNGLTNELTNIIARSKLIAINSVKDDPDTNKFLTISDICITDYSSIVNDFIVLNRPIIFLEPETDLFEHGFALKPDERAGIIAKTKDEMHDAILRSIKHPNEYESIRKQIINKIHFKLDGNASDRVLKEIEKRYSN